MLRCYRCAGVEWWKGLRVGGYYVGGVVHDFWVSHFYLSLSLLLFFLLSLLLSRRCATWGGVSYIACKGDYRKRECRLGREMDLFSMSRVCLLWLVGSPSFVLCDRKVHGRPSTASIQANRDLISRFCFPPSSLNCRTSLGIFQC